MSIHNAYLINENESLINWSNEQYETFETLDRLAETSDVTFSLPGSYDVFVK